jgi:hypothetical protein
VRKPNHVSPSSLGLWRKNRDEFYLRHLAERRPPRLPQEIYMAIGSASDAYFKSSLYERLFGRNDPRYEFTALFESQVEKHNRDWALENGRHVFECYKLSGAYDDLLELLLASTETPRFEFLTMRTIGGVPFLGRPDCRFAWQTIPATLDWKVKGYCSAASPSKAYMLCRDGYVNGKPSRSHNTQHKLFMPLDFHGLRIGAGYLEDADQDYGEQLSIYSWLEGETPGNENVILCIDEIVGKQDEGNKPLLRIANHRSRCRREFQLDLLRRAQQCWQSIQDGWIFRELPREQSDARCEVLEMAAATIEDNSFRENSKVAVL